MSQTAKHKQEMLELQRQLTASANAQSAQIRQAANAKLSEQARQAATLQTKLTQQETKLTQQEVLVSQCMEQSTRGQHSLRKTL